MSRALELISNMVDTGYNGKGNHGSSSPMSSNSIADEPVFIRSSFPNRPDLGLCITLVRSDNNIAKCFNITLVKNSDSNGEEFNPSLPAIPSMVPRISPVSSEASSQSNDSKAQPQAQQASKPVANIQVPQTSIPQVQPNAGMMNNVVLNNSTVPVPPPAMTPVIPTVNAGVGGAAAGLPPQLLQLIQQLQQQPAQQQQIPLFNIAQYQQQLQQQIPIQNQLNLGNVLQGANLMGGGQPNAGVSSQQGSFSGQQDEKGKDDTVYHYASG